MTECEITDRTKDPISSIISAIFRMFGWQWAKNDGYYVPAQEDIETNILDAVSSLNNRNTEETGTGRIMVRKLNVENSLNGKTEYEVYLHIGNLETLE